MPLNAIVIPVYKDKLSDFEGISLQQCFHVLGNHQILFLCPMHLKQSSFYDKYKIHAQFIFIEDENFKSITNYNHMLLSKWFYKLFVDFKYILIYQLDSFVFEDRLIEWIDKGYSFIGAPWFLGSSNNPEIDQLVGVGNGGFSLRNVNDCMSVLKSNKKLYSLRECIDRNKASNKSLYWLRGLKQYFKLDTFKTVHTNILVNEDRMFSLAGRRFQFFNIPNTDKAIEFAFEMQPKKLFKRNNNKLPFGCHAWWKYDLKFLTPFIEKFGYQINDVNE